LQQRSTRESCVKDLVSLSRHGSTLLALGVAAVASTGCINAFWRTEARALTPRAGSGTDSTFVPTPVKAHLADGSTVIFRTGATITRDRISGLGQSYELLGTVATPRQSVPLDSVVGLETFGARLLTGQSVVVSLAATAAFGVGTVALLKALFGSCPTVYADTGGDPVLQAEGFSYAIAPLLEHRDLDPLTVQPGAGGMIRLELRNEALETHFINHVELIAVRHVAGARVVPDQSGTPVLVRAFRPFLSAVDRAGRDVRGVLSDADGNVFASDTATVNAARVGDLDDWIDVEVDSLPPGDSLAIVLRLRNSLLNTVLLYEGILGGRDAPQWMTEGMQRIATAIDLSRWYVATMGMRASVHSGSPDAAEAHARLGDVGPLAFRDVALVLPRPVPDSGRVHIRLRFVADNWRIDQAVAAAIVERPSSRSIPLLRVIVPTPERGPGPAADTAALTALGDADDRYLETHPGQRMTLEFAALSPADGQSDAETTYLIAWQGWYREWIRGSWLAEPTRTTPFVPGDSAVADALGRWRQRRAELERAFYTSRIPVR
jgi:hypothetical protein